MALLDEAGRVGELARMLGGVNLSDRTLAHAREMLDASQRPHHEGVPSPHTMPPNEDGPDR